MTDADLCEREAFARLLESDPGVERKERVIHDYYVDLEGVRFDAPDLVETLYEVSDSNDIVTTFSDEQTKVLKRLGVLAYEGNRRAMAAARLGPNAAKFIDWLDAKVKSQLM